MHVSEREPGDIGKLELLIRAETKAKQRDRYRIALLALRGMKKADIAALLGVVMSTVEEWVYRYRDYGIAALTPRRQPGRSPTLPPEKHQAFKERLMAGPRPEDGVCTIRGKDVIRILNDEFGVSYKPSGVYDLLQRLGFSCLRPRPRHEKNNTEAMEQFKASAPLLSSKCVRPARTRRSASS
jgi:transposase